MAPLPWYNKVVPFTLAAVSDSYSYSYSCICDSVLTGVRLFSCHVNGTLISKVDIRMIVDDRKINGHLRAFLNANFVILFYKI